MGVQDASKILYPTRALPHSLKQIRIVYPKDRIVLAGVDVSNWMVAALNHKDALEQQFMEPPIPVTAVAQYVRDFCMLLITNNIQPVLVFDRQRVPLKCDTNENRYKNLRADKLKLEEMYQQQKQQQNDRSDDDDDDDGDEDSSEKIGLKEIEEKKKKVYFIREDIVYEVVEMAKR